MVSNVVLAFRNIQYPKGMFSCIYHQKLFPWLRSLPNISVDTMISYCIYFFVFLHCHGYRTQISDVLLISYQSCTSCTPNQSCCISIVFFLYGDFPIFVFFNHLLFWYLISTKIFSLFVPLSILFPNNFILCSVPEGQLIY